MPKIFISYRRSDSQYVTDNIYEHMVKHFGEENVFLDVGTIPIGVDFRKYLFERVQAYDTMLVIIGPEWGRTMHQRAEETDDFVRIEVENALKPGRMVIPVLVMEATMPDFSELPESIQDLQWHNAIIVRRQPDFANDCARLADGIKEYFAQLSTSVFKLPDPFAWMAIRAGQVTLSGGHGTYDVPACDIGKYPITVAQYERFIMDDGYTRQAYWTPPGWDWREKNNIHSPRYRDDEKYNQFFQSDHPIAGISWYEAFAFCCWMSEKTGDRILIPTEQQWQRAAQGDDGRAYPWGDTFDPKRCNNSVKSPSALTSPVTKFTNGASPSGVMDMSGNVWEWTSTQFDTSLDSDIYDTGRRVLRGGSFVETDDFDFRVYCRGKGSPHDRSFGWGFRIVRAT